MSILVGVIVIGLVGGIAVGLQGPLSSLISQRLGILESAFIIHLGGAVAALIPLLFLKGGKLLSWQTVPWYALGAGALGVLVLGSLSYMIPRIGVAGAVMVLIAGQLLVSVILDHFGLLEVAVRTVTLQRLIGLLVLFTGVWLTVK